MGRPGKRPDLTAYGWSMFFESSEARPATADDELEIVRRVLAPGSPTGPPHGAVEVGADVARLFLDDGGTVEVTRSPARATFRTATLVDDEALLHPYLAFPVAVLSWWRDRGTFHAGVFVENGQAWAVTGPKEAGKSSTLGWMAQHGRSVLTDDLLVIDDGHALAGPRSIDLRAEAADRFGGDALGMVGARERWRLRPDDVPDRAPIAGFFHLEWADESVRDVDAVVVEPVPLAERLSRVFAQMAVSQCPAPPSVSLDLASLPAFRVVRPRDLSLLDTVGGRMLETIAAT